MFFFLPDPPYFPVSQFAFHGLRIFNISSILSIRVLLPHFVGFHSQVFPKRERQIHTFTLKFTVECWRHLLRVAGSGSDFPTSKNFPELPHEFLGDVPELISLWIFSAIQRFPGSFPGFRSNRTFQEVNPSLCAKLDTL